MVEEGTDGLSVSGSPVNVLQNGTLASVASGTLNSALEFAANVPAGQYQVCIDPPIGWGSAVRGTHVLAGWICSAADVRTGPQLVTFHLTPSFPRWASELPRPAQTGPEPRRGPAQVGPAPVGPAQFGWALLVIAAALIGGLAAATLVHASLIIAVIVSVVAGGIAVLVLFRSPARPPELMAGEREEDGLRPVSRSAPPGARGRPQPPRSASARVRSAADPVGPGPGRPGPGRSRRAGRGGPPAERDRGPVAAASAAAGKRGAGPGRALVGFGSGGAAVAESGRQAGARSGPVHLPGVHLHRAVPALRRVPARHPAGQERLGFPVRVLRLHLDLAAWHAVAAGPGHAEGRKE